MNSLLENSASRTAVGATSGFAALVVFTRSTLQSLAPVLILSARMLASVSQTKSTLLDCIALIRIVIFGGDEIHLD